MATIVVEKDGYVEMDSANFYGSTRSVKPGKLWVFTADHWHEEKEGQYSSSSTLTLANDKGELIATFNPGYWSRVYFKESLADSGGN